MSNSQDQSKVSGTEAPKTPAPDAGSQQQNQSAPKPASDKPNEQQK